MAEQSAKDKARRFIVSAMQPFLRPFEEVQVVVPAGVPHGELRGVDEVRLWWEFVALFWQLFRRPPSALWFAITGDRVLCVNARGTSSLGLRFSAGTDEIRISGWNQVTEPEPGISIVVEPPKGKRLSLLIPPEWGEEAERFRKLLGE